ncbi:GTP pyrophosphokinase family protein [Butyrivibrio sp. JL13D10]|uniref:GTP pyrophosphokinase n=1 Tax=Butyrivibrio sp. JL13D10 TaxID=3236815 RepID=UPI0038B4CDF9
MNLKLEIQKQNYDEAVKKYAQVEEIAKKLLMDEFDRSNIRIMQLPSRIKSWESIEEKFMKKPDRYSKVEDLSDILGLRVICYFLYQVDEAAEAVKRVFDWDIEHSEDKRLSLPPEAFGYLSLHIQCSLRKDMGYPEELTGLSFEIQLRTILQHAWAEIEHDLGYKTVLEIPKTVRREFARIAGLLEIADDTFDKIKDTIGEYERETLQRIHDDTADTMTLDILTLNAFMKHSLAMQTLLDDMAELTGGKVLQVGAEAYLPMCMEFGLENLGDLHELVNEERDHVLELLKHALQFSDLEEITSNAALFYLFRSKMIWGDYSGKEIRDIYFRFTEDRKKSESMARIIMGLREEFDENDKK